MTRRDGSARLFGRARGHALSPTMRALMAEHLPRLRIDLDTPPPVPLGALFAAPVDRIVLEIGFGGGEHLSSGALAAPDTGFIGCEPFLNGVAKLVRTLASEGIGNVRIHDGDARDLLDWLPDRSVDRIDLLYPDPWPKKRHWKRRFINRTNLGRFGRILKPDGTFRFASDIDGYVAWALVEARCHGGFSWLAERVGDWRTPWPGWPGTRYEAKAIREGRRAHYLTFRRNGS